MSLKWLFTKSGWGNNYATSNSWWWKCYLPSILHCCGYQCCCVDPIQIPLLVDRLWHQVLMSDQQRHRSCSQSWLQSFKLELKSGISDSHHGKQKTLFKCHAREKTWKADAGTQHNSFPCTCNARHQVTGGCELTEGTASKTNRLAPFFSFSVSGPLLSTPSCSKVNPKHTAGNTFLWRDTMNRSVLGVPPCTPLFSTVPGGHEPLSTLLVGWDTGPSLFQVPWTGKKAHKTL